MRSVRNEVIYASNNIRMTWPWWNMYDSLKYNQQKKTRFFAFSLLKVTKYNEQFILLAVYPAPPRYTYQYVRIYSTIEIYI